MSHQNRKIRQCPHCKSKKGFSVSVTLGGHQESKVTFQGKILDVERHGSDSLDEYSAKCLDCKGSLDTKLLDIENI